MAHRMFRGGALQVSNFSGNLGNALSSGRKICHPNNISKKKKKEKGLHLLGPTFGAISKPKLMKRCSVKGDDLFFFFFLEITAEYGLVFTSKYKYITTRLRAMKCYESLCGASSNECLCGEKFWRMD